MKRSHWVKTLKKFIILLKSKGLYILPLALVSYLLIFWFTPDILQYLQQRFNQKFVFFGITEPIIAVLKFSLTLFIIIFFPFVYLGFISFIQLLLPLRKNFFYLIFLLGILFFYSGIFFSYMITLPYGIKFLISFKTESLEPSISLIHFVNFFSFFLLAFGIIFELPLILALLVLLRVLNPYKVARYRKEIFFFTVVISAIVTPTPDAINMSLLAIPLYALIEVGLILGKFLCRINILLVDNQRVPPQDKLPSPEA
ncbi:MAG: twin-arginine translocase subunit TatC [Caldimicrobium sp.]|nr:twin-arginine translocase subunit TatC [Caldimicrobium sp.]MDW8093664.1 twin-arginine translocase subunit TatC [Caldimicrobium sp.]